MTTMLVSPTYGERVGRFQHFLVRRTVATRNLGNTFKRSRELKRVIFRTQWTHTKLGRILAFISQISTGETLTLPFLKIVNLRQDRPAGYQNRAHDLTIFGTLTMTPRVSISTALFC